MRSWIAVQYLFVLVSCSGQSNPLPFTEDSLAYLTHYSTYSIDSSEGFPEGGPSGIVLLADLQGFLAAEVGSYGNSLDGLGRLLDEHPQTVPILSFWLDNSMFPSLCDDQYTRKWINWLREIDRPVGIVLGYQVDSPIWNIDPAGFKQGYRCFVDQLREEKIDRVALGWHISSMQATSDAWPSPMEYYPGDEYTDFIALTVTRHTDAHFVSEDQDFMRSSIPAVTEIADRRDLPVVILEANPSAAHRTYRGGGDTLWQNFYAPLLITLRDNDKIVAVGQSSGAVADSATLVRFRQAIIDLP